jgi:hypothetical protein
MQKLYNNNNNNNNNNKFICLGQIEFQFQEKFTF